MKRRALLAALAAPALAVMLSASPAFADEADAYSAMFSVGRAFAVDAGVYSDFKERLKRDYDIEFQLPVSIIPQFATQPGGRSAVSMLVSPGITWNVVKDSPLGDGSLHVGFTQAQYWTGVNGVTLQTGIGAITPPVDWAFNEVQRTDLAWTQKLPGGWLEVTIGQYPFSNIDTNRYAGNEQISFLNFGLSQTASQTYPAAGLGGFVQVNLPEGFQLLGGAQNADDIGGREFFSASGLADGRLAWFAAIVWSGTPPALGDGKYQVFLYRQPSVPLQPGMSQGISFNAEQKFGEHWAGFAMANQASGSTLPVQASIAAGVICVDPWRRDPNDAIGIGLVWDRTNRAAFRGRSVRDGEFIAEAYENFALLGRLIVAPDVQVYAAPALKPATAAAIVLSMRATVNF